MGDQASAASVEPRAVHIDFPYHYSVDGLERTGRVSCDVDERELVGKPSTPLESRIVR